MKEKDVDLSARAAELYYTLCKRFVPKSKMTVEYYPYTSLKGTCRMRGGNINIKISDAFKDSPHDVKIALVAVLLCKIAKKPCPPIYTTTFRDYVNKPYIADLQKALKGIRGKELAIEPKGSVYNLNDSFERVNKKYFNCKFKMINGKYFNDNFKDADKKHSNDRFEKPRIGWSEGRSRNRLGYVDSTTDVIRISRILDDERVPIFVLDYIVYHELLHLKHETVYRNCRRTVHTREFKEDEKRYEEYESAEKWLKTNVWRCNKIRFK